MDIKFVSKTPLSPVDQNGNPIISLALVKEYLRITHSHEDSKIQDLIDSAIGNFEEQTGYRLTPTTYHITFSLRDSLRSNKRSEYSLGDAYSDTSRYNPFGSVFGEFGLDYSHDFRLPLAPVPTQKPKAFRIYDYNGVTLFDDVDSLADNFLFSLRECPAKFRLLFNQSIPTITEASKFFMEIVTGSAPFTSDIKQGLIRYICKMYEFPDFSIDRDDALVSDIFYRYGCSSSV